MSEFNINRLRNVVLQMKLPIAFDVLNSLDSNEPGEPYIVVINEIPSRIHFRRIYDFRYKEEYSMAPFSKMDEDRYALLSYSIVQVGFDDKMIVSTGIAPDKLMFHQEQFLDIALKYLNKFIHSYKKITNSFWLRPVITKDVFGYQFALIDYDDNLRLSTAMIPEHHEIIFNGGQDFKLEEDQDQKLRSFLETESYNVRIDIHFQMYDNFHLGNFNIALLQSVTLFENFIYTNLKHSLSNTKLDKIKKREKCGCLVGISEICARGINEYLNFDFGSTTEWENLKTNTLKLRNEIVHGELLESVTEDQCSLAINSVFEAKHLLEREVFNK